MLTEIIFVIVFSYIFGSIPFGLILTKLFANTDIRKIGSGNIGATNVLRSGNKYLALFTLLLDILKGYLAVYITQLYFHEHVQISALIVFLGHIFPLWLNFKGGKGVATYLGVLLGLSLSLSFLFIFTWIIVALLFKYSSLSSMFATLTVFIVNILKHNAISIINKNLLDENNLTFILFVFLVLIIFTHRENILNLKNKSEKKIKI